MCNHSDVELEGLETTAAADKGNQHDHDTARADIQAPRPSGTIKRFSGGVGTVLRFKEISGHGSFNARRVSVEGGKRGNGIEEDQ